MKVYETDKITPAQIRWQAEKEWIYNGLDTCLTSEIYSIIQPQLDDHTTSTYNFSKSLQGPCLEMRLRGTRIDRHRRDQVVEEFHDNLDRLAYQLERIVGEGVGLWDFNWQSPKQLQELFYDRLKIPVIKRQGRPTVNRDALERMEAYLVARPIVSHIKAMRDIGKKISMLQTEIDPDGRMRTSYNIAGTTTGRLSSSFSEFGTGTNLQNIEESLRSVFIADPGMKMAYFDAKSGESYCVGGIEWKLFKDGRFLDTCETGDVHCGVAKIMWPEVAWTGDLETDIELSEKKYYRHYSRRFMCKKIGHGSNYGGKPRTLATQSKVDISLVEQFQPKYFKAFPAHLRWHANVEHQLKSCGHLISLTGRKRWFFGRRNDDATLREAIAYDPQGSLADILNRGMLQVWNHRDCVLLMQIHDAILVQYPEGLEDEIIPRVQKQLEVPIDILHGRQLVIPYGCKTGWNWGNATKENPSGLKTYTPGDKRQRAEEVPELDRRVR